MSAWGGPKQRVRGVLWGMTVESLLGPIVLGVARGLPGWIVGSFMSQAFIPIINGSNQAIWQSKVPPAVQGRVFATRRMIAQFSFPIAVLLAGPLADPTRLRILRYLSDEPLAPAQLARRLRLRSPTVIHHLDALRLARLVILTLEPEGKRYAVRPDALATVFELLTTFVAGGEE